jgi:hypothetical protein
LLLAEPQVWRRHLALNPREATDANNLIREVLGSDPEHRKALLFCKIVILARFVALSVSLTQKVSLFQTAR